MYWFPYTGDVDGDPNTVTSGYFQIPECSYTNTDWISQNRTVRQMWHYNVQNYMKYESWILYFFVVFQGTRVWNSIVANKKAIISSLMYFNVLKMTLKIKKLTAVGNHECKILDLNNSLVSILWIILYIFTILCQFVWVNPVYLPFCVSLFE